MTTCGETLIDALIDAGYAGREPFECEHPEHWAAVVDGSGWLWWDDPPAECRWLQAHNDCLLPSGHTGDHAYDWPAPGLQPAREPTPA